MGRNNQQRRAAKKRQRQQRRARASTGHGRSDRTAHSHDDLHRPPPLDVEALVRAAVASWGADPARFDVLLDALVRDPRSALDVAEALLAAVVADQWTRGWTPADLVHVVQRQLTTAHAEVAAGHVAADGRGRVARGQELHRRWQQHLDALAERHGPDRRPRDGLAVRLTVEVLGLVSRFPEVPRTMPAPGEASGPTPRGTHLDVRVLARVRALLAQAESTTFEAEADAFTAKAQELIARHAIDEALTHTVDAVGEPSVRRILMNDPYADAKSHVVTEVARANRCRVVYSPDLGWSTAFGYDHDLEALELLVTSLLAQATQEMVRHGSRRDTTGRSRTRSFRRAFLLGFAQRIGQRLRDATDEQVSSTTDASRLLPVLATREDRLKAAEQELFPHLVRRSTSVGNATGWSAGQVAAERARLEVSPHPLT